tara:strand:+ start:88 stop:702 length:615 start_codon:yes stop_codon:yes gene_type:complete
MPRKGQTKYKGMFEVGHRFGEWILLDAEPIRASKGPRANAPSTSSHTYKYKCECSGCETIREVDCNNLEKGISTRCNDCGQKDNRGSNNPAWKGYKEISASYISGLKHGAKTRGYCFEITMEDLQDLWEKQDGLCALTGQKLDLLAKGRTASNKASLDRIDPKRGYTPDNIQWLHKDINFMKRNYNEDYFIDLCKKVADHHKIT